ncbi:hypothetical protein [Zooshikella sp. RANM57]|uniref:hypothetical protein n=1 Tax=Zooshikella sp. RANM57 TaxID=3425863 RepID=UPI003D6EA5F8
MTGPEFKKLFQKHGYDEKTLANALEVTERTIFNLCNQDSVKAHYVYALKYLLLESCINEAILGMESTKDILSL